MLGLGVLSEVRGAGQTNTRVEEEFPGDASQESLVDLLLALGGAVGLELLGDPQQ